MGVSTGGYPPVLPSRAHLSQYWTNPSLCIFSPSLCSPQSSPFIAGSLRGKHGGGGVQGRQGRSRNGVSSRSVVVPAPSPNCSIECLVSGRQRCNDIAFFRIRSRSLHVRSSNAVGRLLNLNACKYNWHSFVRQNETGMRLWPQDNDVDDRISETGPQTNQINQKSIRLRDKYAQEGTARCNVQVTGTVGNDIVARTNELEGGIGLGRGKPLKNILWGLRSGASGEVRTSKLRPSGAARCSLVNGIGSDINTTATDTVAMPASKGVFPGGLRRAEVKIPGLVLRVSVEELVEGDRVEGFLEGVSAAVAGGVTMVLLQAGGEEGTRGAKLYDAACLLKALLRGRADLFVTERVDIAAAAGVDGVLLSDQGLPAVVARRMMQSAVAESSVLPLVARIVSSAQSAVTATASEGADLLILETVHIIEDIEAFVKTVCERVSIPVFLDASKANEVPVAVGLNLVQAGAHGLVLNAADITKDANGDPQGYVSAMVSAIGQAIQRGKELEASHAPEGDVQVSFLQDGVDGAALSQEGQAVVAPSIEVEKSLDLQAKQIVEEERILLTAMVNLVREASAEMEEVSLLVDAVKQLDEVFLLVIVGEFNSGKSSVINALLGKSYLKEGVLPTTNEITLLRHADLGSESEERSERHPDGHFLRFLFADLLKQMNLVDTPGTNVILQRQQRLTEEFVPRADLVLFVLSADRPLTESEMEFLRYIRQWGKKVIFILNKTDVLSKASEVEEVSTFVRENVQRLLSVEQVPVYPVSARQALQAKLSATLEDGALDPNLLFQDPLWAASGYEDLESFILDFLGGSTDAGAERLRLKLETPLGIGVALLAACDRHLTAEALKVEADLKVLASVEQQLQRYEQAMQNDAILQRERTLAVIEAAKGRADKFINSILRLSNIEAIAKYLLGSENVRSMPVSGGFDCEVLGSSAPDVRRALEEHEEWLASNCARQLGTYQDLVQSRWPQVMKDVHGSDGTQEQPVVKLWTPDRKVDADAKGSSISILEGFDTKAAIVVLEQELREVVLSTFGGLGAAGVSASVLTTILPTTLEDLVALGLCSAGGFVGVWNLPLRRADVKKKVGRVADSLARQIEGAMQDELQQSIDRVRAEVEGLTKPYWKAAEVEARRIAGLQDQLQEINLQLRVLRQRVQNLGA